MWIVRKPSIQEAVPSENIEPANQITPSASSSLQSQIECIARQIT
jgi:hypothetical protein